MDASVSSSLVWDVRFRRDLNEVEFQEFNSLLGVLNSVSLDLGREDVKVWFGDSSGSFLLDLSMSLSPNQYLLRFSVLS